MAKSVYCAQQITRRKTGWKWRQGLLGGARGDDQEVAGAKLARPAQVYQCLMLHTEFLKAADTQTHVCATLHIISSRCLTSSTERWTRRLLTVRCWPWKILAAHITGGHIPWLSRTSFGLAPLLSTRSVLTAPLERSKKESNWYKLIASGVYIIL